MVVPCSRLFLPVFARPSFFFFFSGYDFTVTVNCDGVRRRCTVVSVEARSLQNGTVPVLVLAFLYRAAALGNRQLASVLPFFLCVIFTHSLVWCCAGSRLCVSGQHIRNSHRIVAVLPFYMCLCIISQYYLADIFMVNLKFCQASKVWKTTRASLCHSTFTRLFSTQIYHSEKNSECVYFPTILNHNCKSCLNSQQKEKCVHHLNYDQCFRTLKNSKQKLL